MFFFVHFPDWKIGIHCFLAVPTSQVFRYIYLFGTFRLAYRRVIFDTLLFLRVSVYRECNNLEHALLSN